MIKNSNTGIRIKTISCAVPSSILGNIRGAKKAVILHHPYAMTAPNTISTIIILLLSNSAQASLSGNYSNKLGRQHSPATLIMPALVFLHILGRLLYGHFEAPSDAVCRGRCNSRNVVLRQTAFFEVFIPHPNTPEHIQSKGCLS